MDVVHLVKNFLSLFIDLVHGTDIIIMWLIIGLTNILKKEMKMVCTSAV